VLPILRKKVWKRGKWATKAGVSKNSVYEYLTGRRNLTDDNRLAMSEALELKPEDLPN
jgi:plasmid maintenance system antidote protein VapI